MYRRSLALLWTGTILFLILAVIDAMIGFMGHMQGLFIGAMAACFVSAILRIGLHELNETAIVNRTKSEQLRDDVDQLRCQMDAITDKVGEVCDWAEASVLMDEDRKAPPPPPPSTDAQDAVIYQFRLRSADGHDVIVGTRTREPIDNTEELLAALDANDTGTLPGRFSAS